MDWDDVRVFLAVAREGSMRAAGRALGLSQPTIARRLAAFEATFGGRDLVRPPARGAAPQRRRRAAGPGGRERRGCGADAGAAARGGLAGVERHGAGIDRRVRRRVSRSLPVGTDNDGASVRHHLGTGRFATDGKPRATRSRYGVAPRAAGKRRLLHLQGRHLRLCGLPASRRGCWCMGHLYRRASTLCARALGPAAGRGNGTSRWRCAPHRC